MKLHYLVRILCIALWTVAAVNILPDGWLFDLDPDRALFVVAGACVLSYAWIARANAQPATEVYLAGKEAGRREALREQECEKVTRIAERRLSVVPGERR